MFGLRGMNLPGARFGGFEAVYSEIASRLVKRGHRVTIYCQRAQYPMSDLPETYQGVRLKYVPMVNSKNLATLTATFTSMLDGFRRENFDLYLVVNVGMGFHCALAKSMGKTVVMNVDGLDWQRAKWGHAAKWYFRMAARAAIFACDRLITDSKAMRLFYRERYGADSEFITYGTDIEDSVKPQLLEPLGISPRDYYLVMSRMVPENNLDVMIEGFKEVPTSKKLIVAGGAIYDSPFHRRLFAMADDRVKFIGHVHEPDLLRELFCNCYAYLHGHSVGGTNPALLNALGYGCCVMAIDTPFNREVLEGDLGVSYGLLFKGEKDLSGQIANLEDHPDLAEEYRRKARDRIREAYEWDQIVDQYEALFHGLMRKKTIITNLPRCS